MPDGVFPESMYEYKMQSFGERFDSAGEQLEESLNLSGCLSVRHLMRLGPICMYVRRLHRRAHAPPMGS